MPYKKENLKTQQGKMGRKKKKELFIPDNKPFRENMEAFL